MKERNELDVLLPELLSDMGFTILSTPQIGTRQYGVDVVAIGKNTDEIDSVYLFSIKSGDLTRSEWNGNANQALRPSLDEIIDVYIPTLIADEHKTKPIVICLCFGGEIKEEIRANVVQYINRHKTEQISFEEWNGDKLAQFVEQHFLKESFLPPDYQSLMRKSLALLDEPLTSYRYFNQLIDKILQSSTDEIKKLRQVYISLWILFNWCRDDDNLEAAFLSAESALLYSWDLIKYLDNYSKPKQNKILDALNPIFQLYRLVTRTYLETKIIPYCHITHGLSSTIWGRNHIDVNLRMFDILGRLSLGSLWLIYDKAKCENDGVKNDLEILHQKYVGAIKNLINHNSILLAPYQEYQTTHIALALLALRIYDENLKYSHSWLEAMLERINNNFIGNLTYLCTLRSYSELLEHPKSDKEYKEKVTGSSIFYPFLATYAAFSGMQDIYDKVNKLHDQQIPHCNFQAWYLSSDSEEKMWKNKDNHGISLANLTLNLSMDKFLKEILLQCRESDDFKELSAIKFYVPLLILIACRHYQYPVPYDFFLETEKAENENIENV